MREAGSSFSALRETSMTSAINIQFQKAKVLRNRNPLDIDSFRRDQSIKESFGLRPHGQERGRAAGHQASGAIFQPEQCRSHRGRTPNRFSETKSGNKEKPHLPGACQALPAAFSSGVPLFSNKNSLLCLRT